MSDSIQKLYETSSPAPGDTRLHPDTNELVVFDGTLWVPVFTGSEEERKEQELLDKYPALAELKEQYEAMYALLKDW